jgi:hypothetical protein
VPLLGHLLRVDGQFVDVTDLPAAPSSHATFLSSSGTQKSHLHSTRTHH